MGYESLLRSQGANDLQVRGRPKFGALDATLVVLACVVASVAAANMYASFHPAKTSALFIRGKSGDGLGVHLPVSLLSTVNPKGKILVYVLSGCSACSYRKVSLPSLANVGIRSVIYISPENPRTWTSDLKRVAPPMFAWHDEKGKFGRELRAQSVPRRYIASNEGLIIAAETGEYDGAQYGD